MTPVEVLIAAKKKIDAPEKWIQVYLARNADGLPVDPILSSGAVCFCMIGALRAVTEGQPPGTVWPAYSVLEDIVGTSMGRWNDHRDRTHDEVMEAFDKAIAQLEGQD